MFQGVLGCEPSFWGVLHDVMDEVDEERVFGFEDLNNHKKYIFPLGFLDCGEFGQFSHVVLWIHVHDLLL